MTRGQNKQGREPATSRSAGPRPHNCPQGQSRAARPGKGVGNSVESTIGYEMRYPQEARRATGSRNEKRGKRKVSVRCGPAALSQSHRRPAAKTPATRVTRGKKVSRRVVTFRDEQTTGNLLETHARIDNRSKGKKKEHLHQKASSRPPSDSR